jgi:4-amino-4-deoxy-L-arabinose transferase-like glycosyltransferase
MSRRPLALILTLYLLLAAGYAVASPPFETPDEHLHYFTAEFIAREGRLPTTRDPGLMGQEAAQPPLYYAVASLFVRALDPGGAAEALWPNPRVDVSSVAGNVWISPLAPPNPRGESGARPPINANMFVRVPQEDWPWHGYALAARAIRLFSAVLGLGTLLCIHAAGRTVWPDRPDRALLATALVAFLPQFLFIHAAVSNDAAITFFSAAAIWQLLRIVSAAQGGGGAGEQGRRPSPQPSPEGRGSSPPLPRSSAPLLLLGLTIGLAMLSKAAGILLLALSVGVVGLVVLLTAGERRLWRAVVAAAWVAGPALLPAGWLLWRNWTLYGDPTAANQFVALAGGYRPYSLLQVAQDMDRVWLSFFAIFGWMSVQPPAWVHVAWNGIVLAAVLGVLWAAGAGLRGRTPSPFGRGLGRGITRHSSLVTLLAWFLLVTAGWLSFMLRTSADQGRLFFPALTPLALGTAYGLSRWPRPWPQRAAVALALTTAVYCLVAVIPPTFARPPIVAAVPAEAAPLDVTFPEGLQLLGARVETAEARPGEWVWVTLYWRTGPDGVTGAPLVHLELFGRGFERIGDVVAYHGRGGWPATLWPAGAIVADRLAARVRLDDPAAAPVEARLGVKLSAGADSRDVGVVKVVPAAWPARQTPIATLGEGIELAAAELAATTAAPGESVTVQLRWQVAAPPGPTDLHLFVHLGDPTQAPLAQSDGPVMGGQYPPRLWAAGEVFADTATLTLPADLPPGDYPVQIGLYDFAGGARLPVTIDEQRSPTDTYPVGTLVVR